MNRRDAATALLALGAAGVPIPGMTQAPKSGQPRCIGFLSFGVEPQTPVSQRDLPVALRKLGWILGENLVIERAFADLKVERLAGLASDLVSKGVEVILARQEHATLAAARATRTIPIVFFGVHSPVERGFVDSLARPGRNVTGTSPGGTELITKRLQFLREIAPTEKRLACFWPADQEETLDGGRLDLTAGMQRSASSLGFESRFHYIRKPEDVDPAFDALIAWRAQAIAVSAGLAAKRVAELALRHRLPTAFLNRSILEAGGPLSYSVPPAEYASLIARSIEYVDRILRGARPADLPVEQAKKFELVLNLKTAKALGLTVPPSLLQRADGVIQ